jgi:hypothetical protein
LDNLAQIDDSFFALNFEVNCPSENGHYFEIIEGDEYSIKLK